MTQRRRILVTSALPYANGPLHLGHILETIQTDIWVRFQKLRGHECHYVCADDTHGTPIMLKAQSEGITPEQLIAQVNVEHQRDLTDMLVGMDNFGSTHSAENKVLCDRMYLIHRDSGYIDKRSVRQAYDEAAKMFLPDRYVKGICPVCATADQYGDSCENCGSTYTPADLKNPLSVVSGTTPVWRESEHFFFRLSAFEERLSEWVGSGAVQESVARKLDEWFSQGLKDWDISRDAPYFGFEIPDAPLKYFYVWFDAPIGYLASFTQLCARTGLKFEDFLAVDSAAELHHFIGKDILYFHTLFWPAVLQAAGMRRPTAVHAHGFLTINGQKMSKSRGTFITARRYLQSFPAEYLRYYFAAKLGSGIDDMDMNLAEFTTRLNSEIVGKLVNIASRCAGFITKNSGGLLAPRLEDEPLYGAFVSAGEAIAAAYEARDTAGAMREIMALADRANQYVDSRKPWMLAKDPKTEGEVQIVCTQGLNLFRVLMIYLQPVLPKMAERACAFLQETGWTWTAAARPLLSTSIRAYEPLATRLDPKAVAALVEPEAAALSQPAASSTPAAAAVPAVPAALAGTHGGASDTVTLAAATSVEGNLISIDDFLRIDLRVAKILRAELIAGADKLLKLRIDVGELGEREIFAGIRAAYDPAALVGRLIVVVANLEPRKMRFGISEGMMLAAGPGGKDIFALSPDSGAMPGMRVK
ncbi:MAG TPA: methionine--tRNA ligase [Steroidobacteraceae bacterium]|jgi:methionyl-tRNA synthetase|nr:methionine--tRNA ligase [Steroidobacteraceae bacterium]